MKRGQWSRALGLVLLATATALAQPGPARRRSAPPKEIPAACQQMMDDLKAMDARLEEHVKRMNETQGTEKIEAMAAAVNEIAAEHRTMREHMGSMPGCCGMGHGMTGCPMMGR
jgi:hypothetical protein